MENQKTINQNENNNLLITEENIAFSGTNYQPNKEVINTVKSLDLVIKEPQGIILEYVWKDKLILSEAIANNKLYYMTKKKPIRTSRKIHGIRQNYLW